MAAGALVVLHRVGRERQGPLDSVLTDSRGRFRFRFAPDTTAVHILTIRHDGVQYFSQPVATNPSSPDTTIVITVNDTSSTAPVELAARHIVVAAPAEDGTRSVVELIAIRNDGAFTRVAHNDGSASWSMRIPPDAVGFSVSDGELSAGAVDRDADSVLVLAPIAPGERQISLSYLLPAGVAELVIPFDQPAAMLNLMLEETGATVLSPVLRASDSASVIEGRDFRRWTGPVAAGTSLRVALPHVRRAGRWVLPALVGLVAASLLVAAAVLVRRAPAVAADARRHEALLDELARLDAEHAGRREAFAAEAWQRYEARRADLKAELAAALARRAGRT